MKALFISIALVLATVSCVNSHDANSGKVITRQLSDTATFRDIEVNGAFDIEFKQGKSKSITLTGKKYLLDLLKVEYKNGVCIITWKDRNLFAFGERVKASITNPHLENVELNGSCDFDVLGAINGSNLNVEINGAGAWTARSIKYNNVTMGISGSGSAELSGLACKTVNVEVNGSGAVGMSGKTNTGIFELSGVGSIDARKLTANAVDASSSGIGSIRVYAVKRFKSRTSGIGIIENYGSTAQPQKTCEACEI